MNYNEDYTVYVVVNTTNGIRYLTYTPIDENRRFIQYCHIILNLGFRVSKLGNKLGTIGQGPFLPKEGTLNKGQDYLANFWEGLGNWRF